MMNDNEDNDIDDIELGDEDERPFPDSDEAIRALQDVAEAVDELEAECHRLRAELKTSNAERDELRRQVETIKNGFEGGCYLCEVVGEMNKKLLEERDNGWSNLYKNTNQMESTQENNHDEL